MFGGKARPKPIEEKQSGILEALERLVDRVTRGDPESALRWTLKYTRKLAEELGANGFQVSQPKVCDLLAKLGHRLRDRAVDRVDEDQDWACCHEAHRRRYRTGIKVPNEVMKTLNLSKVRFRGEWNCQFTPALSK